jgi:hypothetical protein
MTNFHTCYEDVERPESGQPGTLIYPIPSYKMRTTPSTHLDIRVQSAEQRAARAHNAFEEARAAKIATVDNHRGVKTIREVYPDWTPSLSLGAYRDLPPVGAWWETMDERPTPETCPGIHGAPHRHDGWCQFCGYTEAGAQ